MCSYKDLSYHYAAAQIDELKKKKILLNNCTLESQLSPGILNACLMAGRIIIEM